MVVNHMGVESIQCRLKTTAYIDVEFHVDREPVGGRRQLQQGADGCIAIERTCKSQRSRIPAEMYVIVNRDWTGVPSKKLVFPVKMALPPGRLDKPALNVSVSPAPEKPALLNDNCTPFVAGPQNSNCCAVGVADAKVHVNPLVLPIDPPLPVTRPLLFGRGYVGPATSLAFAKAAKNAQAKSVVPMAHKKVDRIRTP